MQSDRLRAIKAQHDTEGPDAMDVLSDVITTLRTGRPGGGRAWWEAPWGVRFADQPDTVGFLVLLQGSAWLLADASEPVAVTPGDVILSPRGDGYALADGPTRVAEPLPVVSEHVQEGTPGPGATITLCGGYTLDPDRTHPLLRELPATIHLPSRVGHDTRLRAAIDILGEEIEGDQLGGDAILPMALDMLLVYVFRAWLERRPVSDLATGWAAALSDPGTRAALDAIHGDPAHAWTVQELAQRAGLSRAAFSRRFSTLVGEPPLTYLTWWRMTIAAGLLRDSTDPLVAIAARVGYGSEFAFANAFKRHHGLAPGQFRRRARTAPAAIGASVQGLHAT